MMHDRFFGRGAEVDEILEVLDDPNGRVGIYGPPGVGKSHLAERLAKTWADRGEQVAVVDGRGMRDLAALLDALVMALGLPPITELDHDDVTTQLGRALSERPRLLVVLDDVGHLRDEVCDLLARLNRDADLRLVVTSRVALEMADVHALALTPLSEEAAAEMFDHHARRARPGFDAAELEGDTLRVLLEHLDRLPLAIELAAARLTILTPQALVERLEKRFQLLRPGHAPGQRSPMALDEAIGISWAMLDEVQRATLSQCAIFEGGFELDAAEQIVALDDGGWVGDVLQSLVLQSLVATKTDARTGEMRFYLLESIQAYALEHADDAGLDTTGLDATYQRHTDYFSERARAWFERVRGPDGSKALAQLLGETANLTAAFDRLCVDEPAAALDLVVCLAPTFEVRGMLGSYLDRLDACRQLQLTDDWPEAREAASRARLLCLGARLDEALESIDRALECDRESHTPALAEMLLYRGQILRGLGRIEEARAAWKRGLAACGEATNEATSDEAFWRFQLQNELGLLELNRARFGADDQNDALETGAALLGDAYELASQHTHALYRARPTVGWALALHETGEADRALRLLQGELAVQVEADYRSGELLCRHHVAILEFYAGRFDRALELAEQVDRELAEAGLAGRRARNLSYQAIFANAAGRLDEAGEFVGRALDASELTGQEITSLVADVQGLMIAWERGDEAAMRAHLDRACDTAESVGSPGHASFLAAYESFLLAGAGRIDEARARCEEAITQLKSAAEYRRPIDAPRWQVVARAWQAVLELSACEFHVDSGNWSRIYDALASVNALERVPDDALTAVARRHARQASERVRREQDLPDEPPSHVLSLGEQGDTFQLDDQPPVDLSSRAPLRRVLIALAERTLAGEPSADVDAVVAAGWPGEDLEAQSAANRVYATIRMLRNLGLKDVIVTDDDGYRLDDDVLVMR
jgi:predicted ATPase/predicted negative regulator of RcsB-dependent stress response